MKNFENKFSLIFKIRVIIIVFLTGLILSGITAFPIEAELRVLLKYFHNPDSFIGLWLNKVYEAIHTTSNAYPFLLYGTDWLGFAHIVIGVVFIGPIINPIKNIWVIHFGLIACAMVIPFALIFGYIREIPFIWRLIDCSFGVFGALPLLITNHLINKLKYYENVKI